MEKMNYEQLMQNPGGKGSSFFYARNQIVSDLEVKYHKLIQQKRITMSTYKQKDSYFFVFKIPSESVDRLFFDVVLEFLPFPDDEGLNSEQIVDNDKTFLRHHIRIYSNNPSFMFTYTYVVNKAKMIVPQLVKHCSPLALTKEPQIKNPYEVYGFEKTIYFALLYMKYNGFFNRQLADTNAKVLVNDGLRQVVASQNSKFDETNILKKKMSSDKKVNKKTQPKKVGLGGKMTKRGKK